MPMSSDPDYGRACIITAMMLLLLPSEISAVLVVTPDFYANCCVETITEHSNYSNSYACYKLDDQNLNHTMVDNCPSNWTTEDVRQSCESTWEPADVLSWIPVFSLSPIWSYRNVFCAACHSDLTVRSWKFGGACIEYYNRNLECGMASLRLAQSSNKCKVQSEFYPPANDTNRQEQWFLLHFNDTPTILPEHLASPLDRLRDLDFSNVHKCPPGELFDPMKLECRSVWCGEKYQMEDGKCLSKLELQADERVHLKADVGSSDKKATTKTKEPSGNASVNTTETEKTRDNYLRLGGIQGVVMRALLGISMIILGVKVILHFVIKEERVKIRSGVMASLSGTIFSSQLLFLLAAPMTTVGKNCATASTFAHLFCMSSFLWLNALLFHNWKSLSSTVPDYLKPRKWKRYIWYALYSWALPIFLVVGAALYEWSSPIPEWHHTYGEGICLFSTRRGYGIIFGVPLGILVWLDGLLIAATVLTMRRRPAQEEAMRQSQFWRMLYYSGLVGLLMITWIFGIVAPFSGGQVLWYSFAVMNLFTSLYIVITFDPPNRLYSQLRSLTEGDKKVRRTRRDPDSPPDFEQVVEDPNRFPLVVATPSMAGSPSVSTPEEEVTTFQCTAEVSQNE